MRSGRSSSSVIHATSAPLANAHPSPHSICESASAGNEVTRPARAMPVPVTTWASTSDHFRLTVSARTPAGTSASTTTRACPVPRSTSSDGERSATTTR